MTAEEIKQRNIAAMGDELGKQYSAMCQDFTLLYLYWKEFLELFGANEKRIARLNQSAPGFFRMLQGQQFEANMLRLARLTDAPKSVGRANLTVRSLPDLVSDATLKAELTPLLDAVKEKTEFCRDWRNRRFAHSDLLLALQDGGAAPLAPATKEAFSEALEAISALLNKIESFYFKSFTSFADVATHNGTGALLFILGHGIKARDEMLEKIKKGNVTELDAPEKI